MMTKHAAAWLVCAVIAAGCYSSLGLEGDGMEDGRTDRVEDRIEESEIVPDLPADPVVDDMTPDRPPDMPPDGPDECEPPTEMWLSFLIDGTDWPMEAYNWNLDCIVEHVTEEEDGFTSIELLCFTGSGSVENHSIEISATPAHFQFPWEGMEVNFQYVVYTPFWSNRWFALRFRDGRLILGGADADMLMRYDISPVEFYSPVGINIVTGLCELQPTDCFDSERLALDFTFDGDRARIFDRNRGFVGSMLTYEIILETALGYRNITCVDTPSEWYTFVITLLPEG